MYFSMREIVKNLRLTEKRNEFQNFEIMDEIIYNIFFNSHGNCTIYKLPYTAAAADARVSRRTSKWT